VLNIPSSFAVKIQHIITTTECHLTMKAQSPREIKSLDDDEDVVDEKQTEQQPNLTGPITLNVGGTRYTTSLGTLSRFPESVLCKMFAGAFSLKPESDGSYFIDRDGQVFRFILNYLRDGVLFTPADSAWIEKQLRLEATYFQIPSLIKLLNVQSIQQQSALSEHQIEGVIAFIDAVNQKRSSKCQWRRLCTISALGRWSLKSARIESKNLFLTVRTERITVAIYFLDGVRDAKSEAAMCVIDHWSADIKATFVGRTNHCAEYQNYKKSSGETENRHSWNSLVEVEQNTFFSVLLEVDFASKRCSLCFGKAWPIEVQQGKVITQCGMSWNVQQWIADTAKSKNDQGLQSFPSINDPYAYFDGSCDQFYYVKSPGSRAKNWSMPAQFELYQVL